MYLKFTEDKIQKIFLHIIFCQILLSVFECGICYIKNTIFQSNDDIYIKLLKEVSCFLFVLFGLVVGLLFVKRKKCWHKITYEEKLDELVINCEKLEIRLPIYFLSVVMLSSFLLYLSCVLASYYWLYPNNFGNEFFVGMICIFILSFFVEIFLFLSIKETVENLLIALLFLEREKYSFVRSIFERYLLERKEIVVKTEEIDFGFRRFVELGIFIPLFKINFSKKEEAKAHKIMIAEKHLQRYVAYKK